jgi:alpha-glucosidase (family GH31 glycosyl hydrolase)
MMPWNAYGVWWSRYWAYNETGIRAVIEGYESHDLPLNYLVLDVDWHRCGQTHFKMLNTINLPRQARDKHSTGES